MSQTQCLDSELLHRVALLKVPKIGGQTAKSLIAHCGSATDVFKASLRELAKIPQVGELIARNIHRQKTDAELWRWAEKELNFIEKNDVKILFHTDKNYPERLRQIQDAPLLLYQHGDPHLNAQRVIAIVGTRKPTPYGLRMTEQIIEGLSSYNPLIISGLAFGIDAAAHRHSLSQNLPTVAVLGTGLQRIYPTEHTDLAKRMTDEGGGLLTEFTSDQEPVREHFPMRNRIIAGLCDAMIVVETPTKGGSMISATLANDYNRDLFALPARTGDRMSEGCNALIKMQRAQLIESGEDVAYFLRWDELAKKHRPTQAQLFTNLTEPQQRVLTVLTSEENHSIDQLSAKLNQKSGELASILLELEFLGLIKAQPGKLFSAISR
ncbi:MAG: DNA-protecting protein DprA [Bacteroidota bacterium]|jgi:DNA processing protein